MKSQLANLMKQAQKMQDNMAKTQEELARTEVEGQSGGGLVKIKMTCSHEVTSLVLDDSLLGDDRDMLEDLIVVAFNDVIRRAEETSKEKMAGVTQGIPMPPGMKLPF